MLILKQGLVKSDCFLIETFSFHCMSPVPCGDYTLACTTIISGQVTLENLKDKLKLQFIPRLDLKHSISLFTFRNFLHCLHSCSNSSPQLLVCFPNHGATLYILTPHAHPHHSLPPSHTPHHHTCVAHSEERF